MAQLKTTTVSGDLTVTGNIICDSSPTADNHVVTKEYVDAIGTVYHYRFSAVANNSNAASGWKRYTNEIYTITLQPGTYMVTYNCQARGSGTGILTSLMCDNGAELGIDASTRMTAPCSSGVHTSLRGTFPLTVSTTKTYNFYPMIWGNVSWTGIYATLDIVKLTA